MLSVHGRKPAALLVEPVARVLLKAGLTPNITTLAGTALTIACTVVLIPMDLLRVAAILIACFAAFDMVDGTMARLSGGGTAFGATLDASCDRITDGALFAAITLWLVYVERSSVVNVSVCLCVLVFSQVISYIKARGEAGGLKIVGGLVERPERLLVALLALFLEGCGLNNAVVVGLWILFFGSVFTVGQRLFIAARDPHARHRLAPPAGA